jgi:hypothetical protein
MAVPIFTMASPGSINSASMSLRTREH